MGLWRMLEVPDWCLASTSVLVLEPVPVQVLLILVLSLTKDFAVFYLVSSLKKYVDSVVRVRVGRWPGSAMVND